MYMCYSRYAHAHSHHSGLTLKAVSRVCFFDNNICCCIIYEFDMHSLLPSYYCVDDDIRHCDCVGPRTCKGELRET